MARRIFLVLMTALACCAPFAIGQNRDAALEACHWLPDGTYSFIGFCDWSGLKKTVIFSDFGDILAKSQFSNIVDSSPLPESTRENLEWICTARLSSLRLADDEEMAKMGQVRTVITTSEDGVTETRKEKPSRKEILERSIRDDEGKLWILAFDDTRAVVKEGLKDGWLSKTGESFKGRLFLSISAGTGKDEKGGYFAYPTVSNELLVADNIDLLKGMAAAGMGQSLSFVDGTEFTDLSPFIPDLGQSWQVSLAMPRNRETMELWKEHPEMEQRMNDLEEQYEKGLQYEITSFEAGDTIVERTISIFGSDEFASRYAEEIKLKLQAETVESKAKSSSVQVTVSGIDGEIDQQRSDLLSRLFKRSSLLSSNRAGKTQVSVENNIVTAVFVWSEKELQTLRFLKSAEESANSQNQSGEEVIIQIKK
jgi:hypothetical protein